MYISELSLIKFYINELPLIELYIIIIVNYCIQLIELYINEWYAKLNKYYKLNKKNSSLNQFWKIHVNVSVKIDVTNNVNIDGVYNL